MATRGIFDTDGFVTSEAVQIDLPAAGLPVRMVAGLLDIIVVILLLLLMLWLQPWSLLAGDIALLQALVILLMVTMLVAVPVAQETLLRGRTVGKLALGLRTVREDTGPIGFRHALIRALCGAVEIWMTAGSVAVLLAASNEKAKRMGDFAAGTYVVRERVRLTLPPPPAMPDHLVGWAMGADIGVLPDSLAVATRQFLARAPQLTPVSRVQTGTNIYHELLRYVAPAPPPGAHPEAVLSAVMAERRRRDQARLAQHDRLRATVLGPDPLA